MFINEMCQHETAFKSTWVIEMPSGAIVGNCSKGWKKDAGQIIRHVL